MNPTGENLKIQRAFLRQKERLQQGPAFSLTVIFLPFLAAVVLSLFVGLEASIRLQSVAEPFEYAAQPTSDRELWMSIGLTDNSIVIKTAAEGVFVWSAKGPSETEYLNFENHLKSWAKKHVNDVVRSGQIVAETNTAALAIDQRLTYHHIKPVIYALASAGVSRYGFETKLPTK